MSNSGRVIKNTIYLYIRMGVSIVVSVFTTRILLQALGASDYGLYNVVAGAISMLGFLSGSLTTATQRFISYAEGEGELNKIKEIFTTSVILHWIMAIAVCVLFVGCGFLFFNGVLNIPAGRETTAIIVYGCLIISTVFSITIVPYEALLNAHENMLYYSILGIFDVVFKLFIALIIAQSAWDRLLFYGILMAAESFLLRYITQRYCMRHYKECRGINIKRIPNKKQLRQMTSFAGWNLLNIGSGMISLYGMGVVINHFFGTLLNAAMGVANQLSGVLLGVSTNMTKSLTPVLVKSEGAKEHNRMLQITYLGCKYAYSLYAFICIPILFYTPILLELWLKDVPEWTVLFTRLLIISSIIDQLFVFLYQTLQAQGDIRGYNIVRTFVNLLPLVIGVLQYEYGWEPYWIIIDQIIFRITIGGIINLFYAYKKADVSIIEWLRLVFIPCFLATLLSCGIGIFVSLVLYDSLVSQLVGLFILYIASVPIYWFIVLGSKEKEMILRKLKV